MKLNRIDKMLSFAKRDIGARSSQYEPKIMNR